MRLRLRVLRKVEKRRLEMSRTKEYDAIVDGKDTWKIIDEEGNIYLTNISWKKAVAICKQWNQQEYEDTTGYFNKTGLPEGDSL